ncbi:MAG: BrnT family toxin [Selenomonadaceae bacterium]|nr:BrnT family toxin [Selenomonadaceae bacterium]
METTINNMLFEWDDEKAAINWRKHKVDFNDATKVFADENRVEWLDEYHSDDEDRYITVGKVDEILFVVYTEREDVTRLISARRANKQERRKYYAGKETY